MAETPHEQWCYLCDRYQPDCIFDKVLGDYVCGECSLATDWFSVESDDVD